MMKKTILSTILAASLFFAPAFAQTTGEKLDSELALKADKTVVEQSIGKLKTTDDNLAAEDDRIDSVNQTQSSAIAALETLIEESIAAIQAQISDLTARVVELEKKVTNPPPPSLPSIAISAASQLKAEGSSFSFDIARTGNLAGSSSVSYNVSGSVDAADFVGGILPSGVISFAANESSKSFSFQTVDDSVVEPDEAFTVTISSPVGATLGNTSASAGILNNDSTTTPPPVTGLFPNTSDGKPITILGISHHKDWSGENPYKNIRLMNTEYGGSTKIIAGEADPTTGWIYMKPGESLIIGRVRELNNPPANYDVDPGVWVLKASVKDGPNGASTADISAPSFSPSQSTQTVIRKTRDMTGVMSADQVKLTGGANGGWIRVDFWGPQKFENDPLGWHPEFIDYVSRYKIARTMDWTGVIGSKITDASEWVDDGDYTIWDAHNQWGAPLSANNNLRKGGYSFGRIFDLAEKADVASWVNVPITMGGGSVKFEVSTCGSGTTRAQLRAAVSANHQAILAAAETEYRLLAEKMARSAVAENYPNNKVLIVEIGNEIWNYGNTAFGCSSDYAVGLGNGLTGSDNLGQGFGRISAIAVRAFKEKFAAIKPGQELVFVMGWQTGAYGGNGSYYARNAIASFKSYEQANGITKSNLSDVLGGTTGYWSGAFKWTQAQSPGSGNPFGSATETEYNAAFKAAHTADPAAFRVTVKNWHLGSAANQNIARMVSNNVGFRDLAVSNGMRGIIQYEGSAHENDSGTLSTTYPASRTAWVEFNQSKEGYDVQLKAIQLLTAINPVNPQITTGWRPTNLPVADYVSVARQIGQGSPWVEKTAQDVNNCSLAPSIGKAWCDNLRSTVSSR
jgi:hypothetical protein